MIDKCTRNSILYDFYGGLLTKKQQEAMVLYYEENFSLSEIAEEFGISRQGVHDALKNAETTLNSYENKLKLVEKFTQTDKAIENVDKRLEKLISLSKGQIQRELKEIKGVIDQLNR